MMGEYRFLRTRAGTRFAKVTVVSTASPAWNTALSDSVGELAALYGQAIQNGLHLAVGAQNRRKGQPYTILVTYLIETVVDTSPDAVECAVAVATWKSFAEAEHEVSIRSEGGRWTAAFA
jgi:hypothetical protein